MVQIMIIRKTWFYKNLKLYLEVDILNPYHDKTPGSAKNKTKCISSTIPPLSSSLHYQLSMYLHHCSKLDSISSSACSESYTCFSRFPGRINGAVVASTVTTPTSRAVIKPAPVVAVGLKVLNKMQTHEVSLYFLLALFSVKTINSH